MLIGKFKPLVLYAVLEE
jgi:hypothetical protein